MSRKTRKLIWSAPLVAVLAVAGALAIFAAQVPHLVYADALPGTPTGLTAKADGRNAVDLSWNAPTDGGSVDGYRIDRSTNGHTWDSFQGATMDTLIQGTSYKDTMLKPGTDYIYRVFAVNSHGAGPTSDDAGTTTDAIEAPGVVRNLQASDGSYPTKIVLTWLPPADNGGRAITAYYINIKDSTGAWPTSRFDTTDDEVIKVDVEADVCAVDGEMPSTETVTYTHKSLLATVDHSYRVYASNGETADDSNTQSASDTDSGSTGDPIAPDPVTDLVLLKDPDTNNVYIYWVEPESNGGQNISGFRLHVSKTNRHWSRFADATITIAADSLDNTNAVAEQIAVPAAATNAYQHSHVIPADLTGTWYYRIYTETRDADGANDATETPLRSRRAEGRVNFGAILPRQPGTITGTGVSHDQIDLEWVVMEWNSADGTAVVPGTTPPANVRRPTGYRVDVSEDAIKWTSVLEDNTNLALPEFSHETGVEAGDGFMYRVFPIFASRVGPAVHVTTEVTAAAATVPGNVGNLQAVESGAGRIMVTWDAPTNNGGSAITGYRVEESSDQTTWTLSETSSSCELSFTDTGLAEETTLYYRVIALNSVNEGATYFDTPANYPSNLVERSATTTAADLPPKPIGLTVEPAKDSTIQTHGDRGILVYWNAPDDPDGAPIENYRVERRVKADADSQYGEWEWVQTCLSTAGTLLYTHCTDPDEPDVAAGEERMYKVAAQNAAGIGAFTDPITTPRPAADHTHPPASMELTAPTITSVMVDATTDPGTTNIDVAWDNGDNALSHMVLLLDNDADYELAKPVASMQDDGMTTFTDVAPGMYTVVVVSYNASFDFQFVFTTVTVNAAGS